MNKPYDPEAEEAHVRLTEGLKSCRSIVANYRAMIANEDTVPESGDAEAAESDSPVLRTGSTS